jgi:hypothetical protein
MPLFDRARGADSGMVEPHHLTLRSIAKRCVSIRAG